MKRWILFQQDIDVKQKPTTNILKSSTVRKDSEQPLSQIITEKSNRSVQLTTK